MSNFSKVLCIISEIALVILAMISVHNSEWAQAAACFSCAAWIQGGRKNG